MGFAYVLYEGTVGSPHYPSDSHMPSIWMWKTCSTRCALFVSELQQQLLNQQQQLLQSPQLAQCATADDMQQQMALLQALGSNPMLLQQQLAQFQQQGGAVTMEMMAQLQQLQLQQMAMAGQLPEQALAQLVQPEAGMCVRVCACVCVCVPVRV